MDFGGIIIHNCCSDVSRKNEQKQRIKINNYGKDNVQKTKKENETWKQVLA